MRELSLFTGAGGGLLGTKLLGWEIIGYVEKEVYCQKVLRQRITDGILDAAPIFGDIRKFISEGYASSYTGLVDVITAGFPCQPFSVAGKQQGENDERNMWPATADVIGIVKPRFVLLENVPGVRTYLPVVIRDLRQLGYDVSRPLQLGADDVGAWHRRKRVWILADAEGFRTQGRTFEQQVANAELGIYGDTRNVADTTGGESGEQTESEGRKDTCGGGQKINIPDAQTAGLEREDTKRNPCADGRIMQYIGCNRWPVEPDVGRVAHGVASRVDRLKAIGNGQVPRVVAAAWIILTGIERINNGAHNQS
jgi:DNA (cytosine-5)-methyltransferase 1